MESSESDTVGLDGSLRVMVRRLPLGSMLAAASLATAPFSGFLYRNRELTSVADLWLYVVIYAGSLFAVVVGISLVFGRRTGSKWSFLLGWCAFALFWYRDVKSFVDGFFLTKDLPVRGPVIWAFATLLVLILIYLLCERSWFPKAGMWFALTVAVLPFGQYVASTVATENYGTEAIHSTSGPDGEWESHPDIYFLMVDGFGRQDVLKEMFDIDTSAFVSELRHKGFVVADRALAAHHMTWLSVPAVLDQEYQALPGDQGRPATTGRQMAILAGASRTHQVLLAKGYHFVTAATSHWLLCEPSLISEVEDCVVDRPDIAAAINDAYIRYQLAFMTPLLGLANAGLLPDTVAALWAGPEMLEDETTVGGKGFLTRDILGTVDEAHVRHDSTPLFVFGHMMYTHPPFTLGPKCEFRTRGVPDLSGGWDDISGHQAGIDCAIMQVSELISAVDPSAVIVVQADHGPIRGRLESLDDAFGRLDDPDVIKELWARSAILSAVRLPEHCRSSVSDTYAGINTFKVIFDCLAGNPKHQISERSYWAWWDSHAVVDLTDRLRTYETSRDLTRDGVDLIGD